MKIRQFILLPFMALATFSSCGDYLDVLPSTEKEKGEMLSSQDGYRSVLIGAYIRMKQTSLYGQEMVCGTVEELAQHWTYNDGSVGEFLHNYDYKATAVENATSAIFNNLYKVVADVNGILTEIDNNGGVLDNDNYNLIKGEALAIRAFCHFDILRLFGPMPGNPTTSAVLPYVTTVSTQPNGYITYNDFGSRLLQDLSTAEECLAKADPITTMSIDQLNSSSTAIDNFFTARQTRMNYYAVCALKARVNLWLGNNEEALRYAKMIIDAKNPDGTSTFTLGTRDDCSRGDKTFSSEHIFNIKVNDIASTIGSGRSYYFDKTEMTSRLYENGTSDIRFVNMWEEVKISYFVKPFYFLKYVQSDKMPARAKNVIPMVRLAEMYLIAMECSPLSEAQAYYDKLCTARDITPTAITDNDMREKLLIKEYNKEFYGEGQAFYAYKRLAVEDILWAGRKGSPETYVIPLPKQESVYN